MKMRIAALFVLAPLVFAQPQTPAVDYAVPLPKQPFADDAATIWYDSFDDPATLERYFEFVNNSGRFALSDQQALGGTGLSLGGIFYQGTVSSGSLKVSFGDTPVSKLQARAGEKFQEIYWRIYVKHQKGWTGNPAKLSRATILARSNWSQAMIAHVWGGRGDFLTLDPASGTDLVGNLLTSGYNDFPHLRWLGNSPDGEYPIFATGESGKWVAVEAWLRLNTPGASDGAFALWIDGRLDAWRDRLNWRGSWDERGINAVFLENYWNAGSPVEQSRWFDDLVISTRPIGLARAPRNPEVVKTSFEPANEGETQSAFQVQVADACSMETVWDSGTIGGGGDRVVVDAAHGHFRGSLELREALEPGTLYAVRVRQRDNANRWSAWSRWRAVIQTDIESEASPHEPMRRRAPRAGLPAPARAAAGVRAAIPGVPQIPGATRCRDHRQLSR